MRHQEHTCESEATEISEAECCSDPVLDLIAAPCGPRFDLGVVGMLLLLPVGQGGASSGVRCAGFPGV